MSLLLFGFLCAYFFSEQFFHVWDERGALFSRIGYLSGQISRLEPMGKLGESTAHVSHEIKNFLGVLKANSFLIRSKLREADSPEMDRITRSTEHLERFARSILDYSQTSGSDAKQPLALVETIRSVVRTRFPGQENRIRVSAQGAVRILGDSVRLEQVFINLILNSLQAGATDIQCRIEAGDAVVKAILEDDGAGSTPEDLGRLGSPFFTTKKDRGGTGLGLAMASSIVQSHGGTIGFSHRHDSKQGLRVMLSFPRIQE